MSEMKGGRYNVVLNGTVAIVYGPDGRPVPWKEVDDLLNAARPEAQAQLGLFIIVLFKKKQERRVVLSVYATDLEKAKHMALGRYMGDWIVERAVAKADPTVFRVHDDAWYVYESEPPMNSGRD